MNDERHVVTLDVIGRPATFATAHEAAWKEAVRTAVRQTRVTAIPAGRFRIRIEFRTANPTNPNESWDIDNLVKPTLDAMEGVFGLRPWKGNPQAADDRVDHLEAIKRFCRGAETPGATIDVWVRPQAP